MDKTETRLNKLRHHIYKITNNLKDYVPEIAGAAIGASFGNPVIGAACGAAAKKLLESFLKAQSRTPNFNGNINENLQRFKNCTLAATGTAKVISTPAISNNLALSIYKQKLSNEK